MASNSAAGDICIGEGGSAGSAGAVDRFPGGVSGAAGTERIPRQPPQFASSRGHRQGGNSVRQRTSQRSGFIRGRCCRPAWGEFRGISAMDYEQERHIVGAKPVRGSLGDTGTLVQLCRGCSGRPPQLARVPSSGDSWPMISHFLDADGQHPLTAYWSSTPVGGDAGKVWLAGGTAQGGSTCSRSRPAERTAASIGDLALRRLGGRPNGWRLLPVGKSSGEAFDPGIGIGLEVGFAGRRRTWPRGCPLQLVADCAAGTVA